MSRHEIRRWWLAGEIRRHPPVQRLAKRPLLSSVTLIPGFMLMNSWEDKSCFCSKDATINGAVVLRAYTSPKTAFIHAGVIEMLSVFQIVGGTLVDLSD